MTVFKKQGVFLFVAFGFILNQNNSCFRVVLLVSIRKELTRLHVHLRRIVNNLPATLSLIHSRSTPPQPQSNESVDFAAWLEQNQFPKENGHQSVGVPGPGLAVKNRLESRDRSANGPKHYMSRSMSSCIPRLSEIEVVEETFLLTDMK